MPRTPVFAANWKMNKTVAETTDFLAAFLDSCPKEGGRGHHLPAVHRASPPPSRPASPAASQVAAQNMHEAAERRLHRRDLGSDAARARRRGGRARALRAPRALRRDRRGAGAQGARRARRRPDCRSSASARTTPSATRTRWPSVLTRQIEADLAEVPDRELGGRRDRLRADLGDRDRARPPPPSRPRRPRALIRVRLVGPQHRDGRGGADPLRRLGQARQRGRADGPGRRRRGLVGGAEPRGRGLPRHRRGRVGMTQSPPVALIVLDGWGLAPEGPGNAVTQAETPVFDELWSHLSAHDALDLGPRRRPAAGADGQLGGRPPQPRRRRGRQAGPRPHRRRRSPTARSSRTRRCATPAGGRASRGADACTRSA